MTQNSDDSIIISCANDDDVGEWDVFADIDGYNNTTYSDFVPREEYDKLKEKVEELEKKIQKLSIISEVEKL